jgi:hypothetical protein
MRLDRTQTADLFIDRCQLRDQCLKAVELGDLFGSQSKGCRIGKRLGNALAFELA